MNSTDVTSFRLQSKSLPSQTAAGAVNQQSATDSEDKARVKLWQPSLHKHSCMLYKLLRQRFAVCTKFELCDRTACQGITALLYSGQKSDAFCLLLCWKTNYIARQLACFFSQFDLPRVLLHMSLAAYTALDLVACSQCLPVTCNSTTPLQSCSLWRASPHL